MGGQSKQRKARPYRMGERLGSIERTRHRITAATFELHATIGPSRTTVSAIAERAGVQRHTVYAHFPDLDTLYEACTAHGLRVTNMPEPGPWATISGRRERLRHGLSELYRWYRMNERMLQNVLFDVDPNAPPPSEPDLYEVRISELVAVLAGALPPTTARQASVALAFLQHAVAFESWRSLTRAGLTDQGAVALVATIVAGLADGSVAPSD